MLASILIIAFSLILFVYWFRYSCILLLRNAVEQVAAPALEPDTRFGCSDVLERLKTGETLDPLHSALNRDYQMLTYLIEHAAGLEMTSFEDRLLVLDYKVMQFYYRATRVILPEQARKALTEMATVMDVLVQKLSHQAGV
jgi:hypothetical protein